MWQLVDRVGQAGRLGQARQQLAAWGSPHLCVDKLGVTTRERDRPCNPGFQCGEINPENLWLQKPLGSEAMGETPSLAREFTRETHRVLECTQTHPQGYQHQKGPNCLCIAGEVTKSRASDIVPSQTTSPHTVPQHSNLSCSALANS